MALSFSGNRAPNDGAGTVGGLCEGESVDQYEVLDDGYVSGDFQFCRVYHRSLDTERTLKALRPEIPVNRRIEADDFIRKEQLLAIRQNPALRRVYEAGRDLRRNLYYAVVENRAPETLAEFRRFGRFSPADAMTVLCTAAEAFAALEAANLHHGGISAASFVFTADYRLLKLDFMEQVISSGAKHTLADDFRAVGALLFELLVDRKPPSSLRNSYSGADPRDFNATVPGALAVVIMRLLAPSPSARYRSAEELLAAVNLLRAELPPTAPAELRRLDELAPPRNRERGNPLWMRLGKLKWIDGVIAALAVLIVLTVFLRAIAWVQAAPAPVPIQISDEVRALRVELRELRVRQNLLQRRLEAWRDYVGNERREP